MKLLDTRIHIKSYITNASSEEQVYEIIAMIICYKISGGKIDSLKMFNALKNRMKNANIEVLDEKMDTVIKLAYNYFNIINKIKDDISKDNYIKIPKVVNILTTERFNNSVVTKMCLSTIKIVTLDVDNKTNKTHIITLRNNEEILNTVKNLSLNEINKDKLKGISGYTIENILNICNKLAFS